VHDAFALDPVAAGVAEARPGSPRTWRHGRCGGVLLHLIEETARHAGYADIIRESIDGATWYELMAAAEA
jgi:hypothetical protein